MSNVQEVWWRPGGRSPFALDPTKPRLPQIGAMVGQPAAAAIDSMLASANKPQQGLLATAIGTAVLLFSALGVVTFIWPVLAGALAQIIVPPDPRYTALGLQTPSTAQLEQILARFSPSTLYAEIVVALLDPTTRALGPIYLSQLQGAVLGAPLPFVESILIAWPQMVGMIATAIVLFVIGYVIFQRQEVRA